jgi:uncharacterized membrane protein
MALLVSLLLATFLCSLVAGFLFAFAVIVMPGIGKLPDREFIRAFQEMDGIIQRGHPLFGVVWLGSALAVVAALLLGLGRSAGWDQALLAGAAAVYLLGVQLPTFVVNVPMNHAIQKVETDPGDELTFRAAREQFEGRWNRWNTLRTALAALSVAMLLGSLAGI